MISDFQIALAGIAAVVVVAVIAYNRWQESKYKRQAERAFTTDHADVLFGGTHERVDPQLGDFPAPQVSDDVEEGHLSPIVSEPIVPRSVEQPGRPAINAEIDTVALVLADTSMLPDQFWPTIEQSRRVSTHILWEGLVAGLWQPISENSDDDAGFRELRAGLQLASRSGPVDGNTLHAFNEMMAAFAQGIGAVSQREDVAAAMQRAQVVDAFCADTDIEIAVNLIGKSGVTFATTKVRGLAESNGMVALATGEYVLRDDLGQTLYMLRNMNANEPPGIRMAGAYLSGLCFALDVPRTPHPEKTFERMMTLAIRFADTLQGEVVDDNRKLLTANGRKAIVDSITEIAAAMEARNVPPGGSAALRLYS
jgi:hypothetical protein